MHNDLTTTTTQPQHFLNLNSGIFPPKLNYYFVSTQIRINITPKLKDPVNLFAGVLRKSVKNKPAVITQVIFSLRIARGALKSPQTEIES